MRSRRYNQRDTVCATRLFPISMLEESLLAISNKSTTYNAHRSGPDAQPILTLDDVTIGYQQQGRWLEAVRDVSLTIHAGETYGLVGESGSGKSTLALAALRYLAENGAVRGGRILLREQNLLELNEPAMRRIWASQMKLVPQNALSSLNPSLRIGEQLAEGLPGANGNRDENIHDLLRMVRLADPERVAAAYPHQLSGGMQQRIMIALALGAEPDLLVLDEPTTALDVTTEAAILDLVGDLIKQRSTAVLFVSHNLGVVADICDRVAVLYAGELVEDAPVDALYAQSLHPYTRGLLKSVPRLGETKATNRLIPIPGSIPRLGEAPPGCVFAPRCPIAQERCHIERPSLDTPLPGRRVRCHRWPEILDGRVDLDAAWAETADMEAQATGAAHPSADTDTADTDTAAQPVLSLEDVEKSFKLPRSLGKVLRGEPTQTVRAVDGVNLDLAPGETLGLVGESGSGKTTLARCIIGLTEATGGGISLLEVPLARSLQDRDRQVLHQLQMVFQNPDEALNPYLTVAEALRRPLRRLAGMDKDQIDAQIGRLLEMVKLRPEYAHRLPGQLSGGEKQRVAIARAFAAQPDLLIFDESVSALDVSVQASILNLLNELQQTHGSAYLFITHDLSVVSYLADVVAVIYLGKLMEVARVETLLTPPYHPYTEALLSAIPVPDPHADRPRIRLDGEAPSPTQIPSGCPFHTRCPRFLGDICVNQTPPWRISPTGDRIFCHIPLDELAQAQAPIQTTTGTAPLDAPSNGQAPAAATGKTDETTDETMDETMDETGEA